MNDPKRLLIVLLGFILLCGFAFGVKGHMDSDGYKTQVKYQTAIQATDKTHFNYAVDTQQGNLLAHGTFTTDTAKLVKFPEMKQSYTYVDRVKEHYTMHTREVCEEENKEESCHTEIYYTWDEVADDTLTASKVNFYGRQYNPAIFSFRAFHQSLDNYYLDGDDRYTYDIVPQTLTATFLASSMGGGLHGSGEDVITLQNKSIGQAMKDVGKYQLVAFWVCTVIIFFLFVFAAFAGYEWVMEDGVWSTKD